MPKINVYVSEELAEAIKEADLPVSPICQRALESAVRRVAVLRETAEKMDLSDLEDDAAERLERFTARARYAVKNAAVLARRAGAAKVGTGHLLIGILDVPDNMALQVLRSLDIEPDDLREELADDVALAQTESDTRQFDETTSNAMKFALSEALRMGHNYIGCEHLLLGLIAEPDGSAGTLLRSRGAELRISRKAVSATLAGFVYAQSRQGQPPVPGAEKLKEVLGTFGQRLDKLEQAVARLAGERS
jgi:ATP-dependent Clp protease ATP-binding subunit ClpC